MHSPNRGVEYPKTMIRTSYVPRHDVAAFLQGARVRAKSPSPRPPPPPGAMTMSAISRRTRQRENAGILRLAPWGEVGLRPGEVRPRSPVQPTAIGFPRSPAHWLSDRDGHGHARPRQRRPGSGLCRSRSDRRLGSASASPTFSPILSSQVAGVSAASSFASVERSSAIARFISITSLRYCFLRISARIRRRLPRGRLAMGGNALGRRRSPLLPVDKARCVPGAEACRTECRFDQRPVQRRPRASPGSGTGAGGTECLVVLTWELVPPPISGWLAATRPRGLPPLSWRPEPKRSVRSGPWPSSRSTVMRNSRWYESARPYLRDRDMTFPDPLTDQPIPLPGHAGKGIASS